MNVPQNVLDALTRATARHGVELALALGLSVCESGLDPNAEGDYDAAGVPHSFGLMQLYDAGAGYGHTREELLNLDNNTDWGCAYLRSCIDAFPGDIYTGVSAYNQGIGGARERGWSLNAPYVRNVLFYRDQFRDQGFTSVPSTPTKPGCWSLGAVLTAVAIFGILKLGGVL